VSRLILPKQWQLKKFDMKSQKKFMKYEGSYEKADTW